MKRYLRWNALLAMMLCSATAAIADELPLFDGHIHYSVGSPQRYPPEEVIRILDAAGITGALLSSTPNDGTRTLYAKYPQRFIAELRPYRNTRDFESWAVERANWYRDPGTVTFVEQELKRGIYRGIGEFHADGDEAATPQMRAIAQIAERNGLWLHAHSDAAAVEHLFAHAPTVTIVWAHAGMSTPPAEIERMLARYPRLFAELSYRYEVASNGIVDPVWRALFLRFPQRFIYGTDTWIPMRWEAVIPLARAARDWLSQLPPEVAENIAFRNAERLFPIVIK